MLIQDKELLEISNEIRDIISNKQRSYDLTFVEDTHTYYIRNLEGEITTKFPSVSTVIKQFYNEFPDHEKSFEMCDGDLVAQDELLKKWRSSADYANSIGSRTHFLLEKDLLELYGSYKEVRKPIFDCDQEQTQISNLMIDAGHNFIQLMHRRKAVLLDTEMVLGCPYLGYTGQPDKVWLIKNENGEIGLIITDWKTNKPKNFEVHSYTKPMLPPFEDYMDTSLSHYMIQLPSYGRLLLNMLKGSKYENIKLFGCIIVHLLDTGTFKEYRIPRDFINKVLTMDMLVRIDRVIENKYKYQKREEERLRLLNEIIKK